MKLPAGFKDWRTTGTGIITLAAAFVSLYPELFPETELWAMWVRRVAAFVALVSGGAFVVQTPSAQKVKEKTAELVDRKLEATVDHKVEQKLDQKLEEKLGL